MKLKLNSIHEAVEAANNGLTVECFLVIGENKPAPEKVGRRSRSMITSDNTVYAFHGANVPDLMPGSDLSKMAETLMNTCFKGNRKSATRAEITAQLSKTRKWKKKRSLSCIANLRRREILEVTKL